MRVTPRRGDDEKATPRRGDDVRAISTVLDASLCLLLVSASAVTLAGTPVASEPTATVGPDTADETADLLTTSTARVSYEADAASGTGTARDRNLTVHDTLAGLLASAASADAGLEVADGSSATAQNRSTAFVRAVTERVGRALRRPDVGVQVVALRSPTAPNSTHGGRVVAGATPPDGDVHAAGFTVRRVEFTVRTWLR